MAMSIDDKVAHLEGSTDLVTARAVLAAPTDNTACRWLTRSLTQKKVVEKWAVTRSSDSSHRGQADALRVMTDF
eukprot:2679643-Prymnesium_polylepis.1